MKKILFILFLSLHPISSFNYLLIGTASLKGMYYPTGWMICKLLNKYKIDLKCLLEPTEGSVSNIDSVKNNELDLAIVQSDVLYQSYSSGKDTKGLRTIMAIYTEVLTLVANKSADINSLKDTKNKRVNIGAFGSGNEVTSTILYNENKDISLKDLGLISYLKVSAAPKAMMDNKIDAYIFMVGHPAKNIQDIAKTMKINIVPIEEEYIDLLVKKYPYYVKAFIPGGLYEANDKDIPSFGVKAVLITNEKTDDKVIYSLVRIILENFEEFKKFHPAYANISKKSLLKGLSAPLHRGARRYYKEIGLIK